MYEEIKDTTNIITLKNNKLEIHFSPKKKDESFFNIGNYVENGKIVFLSHYYTQYKLVNIVKSTDKQIVEFNDKDNKPLENLDVYMRLVAPCYQIIIEGIDYHSIKDNLQFFASMFRGQSKKIIENRKKIYFGIINVPLKEREELKKRIYMYVNLVRICLPIMKKKIPPKQKKCKITQNRLNYEIQIYPSINKIDYSFLDFSKFTENDRILFFSYNLTNKQLLKKLELESCDVENIDGDKDPLFNLEKYKNEKYNNYEILIEGIDYLHIEHNFNAFIVNFNKARNETIKYHFNIVNFPILKVEKYKNKLSQFFKVNFVYN